VNLAYFDKQIKDNVTGAQSIIDQAEVENRGLTEDEDRKIADFQSRAEKAQEQRGKLAKLQNPEPTEIRSQNPGFVPAPIGEAPAVHTEEREYSFAASLRQSLERNSRGFHGLEGEVHAELLKLRTKHEPPEGILIPNGNERELRKLMYGKKGPPERRDFTTTTGAGSVFVTAYLPFIELLRNSMVTQQLGCTFLTGLQGKFAIPRQNAASTGYWVGEGVSLTASNPTLDQVALVDKTLGAMSTISRKMLYQSSIDVENFIRNDLAAVIGLEWDRAAINGSGSGAVPQGILQNPTVPDQLGERPGRGQRRRADLRPGRGDGISRPDRQRQPGVAQVPLEPRAPGGAQDHPEEHRRVSGLPLRERRDQRLSGDRLEPGPQRADQGDLDRDLHGDHLRQLGRPDHRPVGRDRHRRQPLHRPGQRPGHDLDDDGSRRGGPPPRVVRRRDRREDLLSPI
jgi:HK97 family phage major capsid protein